tara:strand:+ start:372 stop:482 length:111 start_codon:yes stop_codon:yes gene_type:complete
MCFVYDFLFPILESFLSIYKEKKEKVNEKIGQSAFF